jgi:hypothetical protein
VTLSRPQRDHGSMQQGYFGALLSNELVSMFEPQVASLATPTALASCNIMQLCLDQILATLSRISQEARPTCKEPLRTKDLRLDGNEAQQLEHMSSQIAALEEVVYTQFSTLEEDMSLTLALGLNMTAAQTQADVQTDVNSGLAVPHLAGIDIDISEWTRLCSPLSNDVQLLKRWHDAYLVKRNPQKKSVV